MIRIVVDAMGGDYAPREVVYGAVLAAKEYGIAIQLVGPPDAVGSELKKHSTAGLDISIVPASEVVSMDEKPSRAIVKKKDSSIVVATRQLSEGLADGMVAAGSTGATAVAAQMAWDESPMSIARRSPARCRRSHRSAASSSMSVPTSIARPISCGSSGTWGRSFLAACTTSKIRASASSTSAPKTLKATSSARIHSNFSKPTATSTSIGFVEGRDFPVGKVDVVVTDGFTGNVALKTAEASLK